MKRSAIRPKPKQGKSALIAAADRLIQIVVHARDSGICQKCGLFAHDGHHIMHRRYFSTRWMLENVVSLCRNCHTMDGTIHKSILTAFCTRWVGGQDAMDALRLRAHVDPSERPEDAIDRLKKGLDK